MSLKSIVTVPMLRVSRTRPPLRLTSMISPALEALKSSASAPVWPSTVSLASPGSHWKRSSPAPSRAVSAPRLPSTWSLPLPPSSVSAPSAPRRSSSPSPPSSVSAVSAPMPLMALSRSAPPRPWTVRLSTARWLTTAASWPNVATGPPLGAMPIVSSPSVPRVNARSAPSPPSMSTCPGPGTRESLTTVSASPRAATRAWSCASAAVTSTSTPGASTRSLPALWPTLKRSARVAAVGGDGVGLAVALARVAAEVDVGHAAGRCRGGRRR